jgi:probable HAF family extracellular repeat protein
MRRKRLFLILGCAAVLIAAGVVVSWLLRPEPLYRVTFLPLMGGVQTRPYAINDSGRVAVVVRMADGTERVVLWDKSGQTEELVSIPPGSSVPAMAINNAGEVACTVFNDPNRTWISFFWDVDRRRYTLDAPSAAEVRIRAMNNRGQVVGYRMWLPSRGPAHAFLWDKAAGMQDLGMFSSGGESVACDLNDQGQIVGYFAVGSLDWRAFVYDPDLGVRELGFKKSGSDAQCLINDRGFVVGQFNSAQSGPGVSTWTAPTGPQTLPWKGGGFLQVRGLNNAGCYFVNVSREGIRVGRLEFRRRSESHLWQSGRHVRQLTVRLCCGDDLRHRNVTAVSGWDINKDGTILGAMTVKGSGQWHAVILEPIQ